MKKLIITLLLFLSSVAYAQRESTKWTSTERWEFDKDSGLVVKFQTDTVDVVVYKNAVVVDEKNNPSRLFEFIEMIDINRTNGTWIATDGLDEIIFIRLGVLEKQTDEMFLVVAYPMKNILFVLKEK